MSTNSIKAKPGRHAPAFVLLILAKGPNHGLGILNVMDQLAPGHRLDSAVIYRVLKKLEDKACITSDWQESESGPKKKVYSISPKGRENLSLLKEDILSTIKRLQAFIDQYNAL